MKDFTFWVGLDVHADVVKGSVFGGEGWEPVDRFELVPDEKGLRGLVRRLRSFGQVRCVYEAGPCGYSLQRYLSGVGIVCEVAAPSLIPRRPGDRVKTDRRDADKLGRLYRSGQLTMVAIPDQQQEGVRDLVRAREDARVDLLRRRHRLSKFLLRRGYRYRQGTAWTQRHWRWIDSLGFADPHAQAVLEEAKQAVQEQIERVRRFDQLVEQASERTENAPKVNRYKVLRGVSTTTAMTVLAEAGDLRRYRRASQFMGSTGLVPSEHSSGGRRRQGAITKTGNAHLRRILVEAAWQYRHRPTPGARIRARRKGQPEPVLAIARRADFRLHRKFRRLLARGKTSGQAVVAVARELAGFFWALQQVN